MRLIFTNFAIFRHFHETKLHEKYEQVPVAKINIVKILLKNPLIAKFVKKYAFAAIFLFLSCFYMDLSC